MDNGPQNDRRNQGNRHQAESDRINGKQRYRVSQDHGTCLQIPPLREIDDVWRNNLDQWEQDQLLNGVKLEEIRRVGRSEIIELANRYTQKYLDAEFSDRSHEHLILAGHQPELFHCGVWYKNFVLSELGSHFNCVAVNLIVDNDICKSASIRYPHVSDQRVAIGSIPLVEPGEELPYESRVIGDWEFFLQFQNRAQQAIQSLVDSPIVNRLWPNVVRCARVLAGDQQPRLGQSLAAGRHCLENEVGLRTLEVPISWMAESRTFTMFVESILLDLPRFRNIHNDSLLKFRKTNHIRSRSHPVPELEVLDGWNESPFWVWGPNGPSRRRLFSRRRGDQVLLSDLSGWETGISTGSFAKQFRQLASGVAIRPRALTTTMFSRLMISDLFLHGIGGAKYDQLTDVIAQRFFSIQLPRYLTLSATMKLPTDIPVVRRNDVVRIDQFIRKVKYHPESLITNPCGDAVDLIEKKRDWTVGSHLGQRSSEKHQAIRKINQQLQNYLDTDIATLTAKRNELYKRIPAGEVLDSREYSYCLFPDSLIPELTSLASLNV